MTSTHLSRRHLLGLGLSGTLGLATGAIAQEARPVRVVLPVSAGSGVDTIARSASVALGRAFGQPVVIENLPGAGGVIGASAIAKAAPDGHTLGFVSNNHVINPAIYKKMPFHAIDDFTVITVVGATPLALVVNPRFPARTVPELVALLKAEPQKYNYASSGNGTVIHLGAELFLDEAKATARHIPYKGTGPMVTDLIAGTVDFGLVGMSAARAHLQSGALRALGICSPARSAADPQTPTVAEQGLPNFAIEGWFAFIGPAKMSAADTQRAHKAIVAAFQSPEVLESMAKAGTQIKPSSPAEALAFFRAEADRYARLAQKAGVTLQ